MSSDDRFCLCGALLYDESTYCYRCSVRNAVAVEICTHLDSDQWRTVLLNDVMRSGRGAINPKLAYDGIEEATRMMKVGLDEWLEARKVK